MFSSRPELGWRVKPRTCISYTMVRDEGLQRRVAFPIVGVRIDYHTLHGRRCVVAFLAGHFATVVLGDNNSTTVWIQQDLGSLSCVQPAFPSEHLRLERRPVAKR